MTMQGKTALIFGVANEYSIAWGIAKALHAQGARLALAYQGERVGKFVERLAQELNEPLLVSCDVTNEEEIDQTFAKVGETFGRLDMLVHAIAFAKKEDLSGGVADTSREGYLLAQEVSAYSLLRLARGAKPLMEANGGGSIVTMTYLGGERVIPNYNVMGMCKSALESATRYLAWELGPSNIRVNALSSGPVKTMAARGIAGFTSMLKIAAERAPLQRNVTLEEVGNTASFLLSDAAGGITGQVIYCDAGYSAMGM